jgi:hypothetical protein
MSSGEAAIQALADVSGAGHGPGAALRSGAIAGETRVLGDATAVGSATAPNGHRDRLAADRELVAVLAASEFEGPRYDMFVTELARYGVAVLCGWMHSGHVFAVSADRGQPLSPNADELEELHRDLDTRQDIASMVVAVALRHFRERALVGGGWKADGGASLTTYFMGACLTVFPNEFRRYRAQRQRWRRQNAADPAIIAAARSAEPSIAEMVGGTFEVKANLARVDARTRAIVTLWMYGYHQQEIAEMLGERSARAVEGVLYRWRRNEVRRMREGGE